MMPSPSSSTFLEETETSPTPDPPEVGCMLSPFHANLSLCLFISIPLQRLLYLAAASSTLLQTRVVEANFFPGLALPAYCHS